MELTCVSNMKTKRVLVTGASGFIGRPLLDCLLIAGYSVRAATRSGSSLPKSVEIVTVPDFTKDIDWNPIVSGIDFVIHLAGLAHVDPNELSSGRLDSVNCIATQKLAIAAKKAGVDRFVFISSVRAQVGPSSIQTICEKDEACPTDDYGHSKLAAEATVRATSLPFTILRPVVVYGPNPRANIKTLVRFALSPFPLPFLGLNNRRSLLSIDNFLSAILFVLNTPTTVGEIYLVADARPLTLGEIFTMLRQAQGRSPGLFYIPPPLLRLALILLNRRDFWQRMYGELVVDTTKLQSLGWHPTVASIKDFAAMIQSERQASRKSS